MSATLAQQLKDLGDLGDAVAKLPEPALRIGTGLPGPGRPSIFSMELAKAICDQLEAGVTLQKIGEMDGMPTRSVIWQWRDTYPVFQTMYDRARQASAEALENEALQTVRDALTKEQAYAASTRFDVIKWVAAKRNPETYGEKITQDVRFSGTLTVDVDLSDRDALLVELQRKLGIEAAAPALLEGVAEPSDDSTGE